MLGDTQNPCSHSHFLFFHSLQIHLHSVAGKPSLASQVFPKQIPLAIFAPRKITLQLKKKLRGSRNSSICLVKLYWNGLSWLTYDWTKHSTFPENTMASHHITYLPLQIGHQVGKKKENGHNANNFTFKADWHVAVFLMNWYPYLKTTILFMLHPFWYRTRADRSYVTHQLLGKCWEYKKQQQQQNPPPTDLVRPF